MYKWSFDIALWSDAFNHFKYILKPDFLNCKNESYSEYFKGSLDTNLNIPKKLLYLGVYCNLFKPWSRTILLQIIKIISIPLKLLKTAQFSSFYILMAFCCHSRVIQLHMKLFISALLFKTLGLQENMVKVRRKKQISSQRWKLKINTECTKFQLKSLRLQRNAPSPKNKKEHGFSHAK